MKIYIDNIVLNFQVIGGISVYITNLIKSLIRDNKNLILVEQNRVKNNILRNKIDFPDECILKETSFPLRLLSYLPIPIRLRDKAVVHSSYYRICNSPLAANIVTVYDFNYELGYVRRGVRKYLHCRQKKQAVEKADGVICISESTKRDLLDYYPHVDSAKIKVIHLAADKRFFKVAENHESVFLKDFKNKKYVLFVGARIFHKNFEVCVDTLQKLKNFELFVVGPPLTKDEADLLEAKLPSRYHSFCNVSVSDLNCLYNNAHCFFYPTNYEGFGIPVLEAMQAGCPVVSTNKSSIPEVAGTAGLLAHEISLDSFAEKILSLENPHFRLQVINAGFDQAKKFSWEKTYQETLKFYHEVFQNKFG